MNLPRLTDTTLRDGSHAMRHQFTRQQVRDVVQVLDRAGVPIIEVSHGDGLGWLLNSVWYVPRGRDGVDRKRLAP